MATEHGDAQNALEAFLLGKPKPTLRIPPAGWGAALSQGSANIPLMFVAAAYGYNVPEARERVLELIDISKRRFMMAEPFGAIYPDWHLKSWLLIEDVARKRGDAAVLDGISRMIDLWIGIAEAMSVVCPIGNLSHEDPDETKYIGKRIVCWAGCRAWEHSHGLGLGVHSTHRISRGEEQPKGDDWGGLILKRCLESLRAHEAKFKGKSLDEIVALVPRYAPRVDFQFRHYADGSKVMLMGLKAAEDASDPNGNTHGYLAFVYDAAKKAIFTYPEWPNPRNGDKRIRQVGAHATLRPRDGGGWLLRHGDIGRILLDGRWETIIPEPAAALVSCWDINTDGSWIKIGGGGNTGGSPSGNPAVPPVPTPPPPVSQQKESHWRFI